MSNRNKRWTVAGIIALAAATLAVFAYLFSAAQWGVAQVHAIQSDRARLKSVEQKIDSLEMKSDARDDKLNEIGRNVAVITERTRWLEELRKERGNQP